MCEERGRNKSRQAATNLNQRSCSKKETLSLHEKGRLAGLRGLEQPRTRTRQGGEKGRRERRGVSESEGEGESEEGVSETSEQSRRALK